MKNRKINLIDVIRGRIMENGAEEAPNRSILFLNPYSYLILRNHPHLLVDASKVGIDGQLLAKILSMFWAMRVERISFDMTSLAHVVFDRAAERRERAYIIGSTPSNLVRAVAALRARYPDLIVCGSRHGYFADEAERQQALDAIMKADADVLICGMGTPHQERFLYDLRARGWIGCGYTCGGFLHQTAKKGTRYYPGWINRLNLRWAYRIYDEPRLFKRYFFHYPVAVLFIVKDCLRAARAGR